MVHRRTMADKLTICVDEKLAELWTAKPELFKSLPPVSTKGKWTKSTKNDLLTRLSECLLDPGLALEICSTFRALLLQLLYGAADLSRDNRQLQRRFCVTLSKLVLAYPHCIPFALNHLHSHPCFLDTAFKDGEPAKKRVKKVVKEREEISGLAQCKACYTFLLAHPEKFRDACEWSGLTSYLEHPHHLTKWYAAQSICIANGVAGRDKQLLLNKYFTKEQQAEFLSHQLGVESDIRSYAHVQDTSMIAADPVGDCVITCEDLHSSLTLVTGIILPKMADPPQQVEVTKTVVVPSTLSALQSMAMAVSSHHPVILSGHIGAGKTSLVDYLAHLTNRHKRLIKVQLGEQIDSKTLLGSYCCTETPGQFVWRPGPLTTAVTTGQWLLLEDIDIAPMDVISSLLTLIETGSLPSNQGHSTRTKPGFQLFMTKRLQTAGARGSHTNCSLLEKSVMTVTIQPLSRTELSTIIHTLYPNLDKVVDRLLDMYFTLSAGKHVDDRPDSSDIEMVRWTSFYGSRKLSARDLLRWCCRISDDFELISADNEIAVFQEALDCFCDSLTKPSQRLKLAEAIGTKINVTAEKANYYCNVYKPSIEMSTDLMKVGRASLDRKHVSAADSLSRQSSSLLEKICVCVKQQEPVLLVGETGTGKTSVVQYLAAQTGRSLTVINMNQQSDSTDLLGGYKPVTISRIVSPLREQFESLFCKSFSRKQNQVFLGHIQQCFNDKRWTDLLKLIEHTVKAALTKTLNLQQWSNINERLTTVKLQVKYARSALAFSFVEGALVRALINGDWVLLDEINLATAETLDCLCGLLDSSHGSLTLVERGDAEPVDRHTGFRLFACMNPATDVGKKELTAGVRSRFTEFFVDELDSKPELRVLVNAYLSGLSLSPKRIDGIVNFYLHIKQEALVKLTDGTGKRPTYSLRTLCRALRYAASNPYQAVPRSLYEAFCMSFLTQVDRSSHPVVTKLVIQHIVGKENAKAVLSKPLLPPIGVESEKFEDYWLKRGMDEPIRDEQYILTETVKANMKDVARVVACGRHPVLLQGETSVGKTSMIEYIAKASGNRCVRINNHEHTDVQEYTGSYVADEHGHLVFKEGILVDAMRNGYWIILDELNLAPSDVLESLNRLLDDNRELFIAETQTTVKAHPGFILFATQNPPGLYGGRKMLSRAFSNRFVELHFDEIPNEELEQILHRRCHMPLSSSKRIIKVMSELQLRRRDSGLFAGKQGYITLRDVFRWGERYRQCAAEITDTFYDWDKLLADQGFMLLAGRVRKPQEELIIAQVLEKHFKRRVSPAHLFSLDSVYVQHSLQQIKEDDAGLFDHIVWTYSLSRLAVLVGQAMKYNEPVLMVGDTGCGKTTICQYFAHIYQRELYTVNCHMHTEGSHFLGALRPVRHTEMDEDGKVGRLFEWQDGPLVTSMLTGSLLLVDEISLADDSVLERLNSVLEPSRTLVLAEKGGELEIIKADADFRIVATMNPAGDYGKKELSPALRNRFTEIWCPQSKDLNDFKLIIDHNISTEKKMYDSRGQVIEYSHAIVEFIEWFHNQTFGRRYTISVRDVLAWVNFINKSLGVASSCVEQTTADMYIHGACLVFLDALGSANISDSIAARESCHKFLYGQVSADSPSDTKKVKIAIDSKVFTIGSFSIPIGTEDRVLHQYTLEAPSTSNNCMRLVRGLQLNKPILLEGSPGVGKTSLVTALAKASGHRIVRINLSQQTDIADLFGADLPVEGGSGGQFAWRDGLFLQALKLGHWVVLDELNLASQSVLEGLNACFDHRAEVYVPELCKSFHIQHQTVKIFACQNPLKQGGGRQGLPQSFLNRFTQVYVDEMEQVDQEFITSSMYPAIPQDMVEQMVHINSLMVKERLPGEYNLRDTFRWCELIIKYQRADCYSLAEHFSLLYVQPLRPSPLHCEKAYAVFELASGTEARHDVNTVRTFQLSNNHLLVGNMLMERTNRQSFSQSESCVLHKQLPAMESLATCLDMGWMAILDGPDCSGKSTLAHMFSNLIGQELKVFSMNSAMDTSDLLGGFEQADVARSIDKLCISICTSLSSSLGPLLIKSPSACKQLMSALVQVRKETDSAYKLKLTETLLCLAEDIGLATDNNAMGWWRENITDMRQKLNADSSGTFEWQDSVLVEAVRDGHWLLIENANVCSASVLDRLNGLLEPNGTLTITERGVLDGVSVTIRPHTNFRLILTANTQQTDLSRALKNRGVVISTHTFTKRDPSNTMDEGRLYSMLGLSKQLVSVLKAEHQVLWECRQNIGDHIMLERARLFMSFHRRGFSVPQALAASRSFYRYYSDSCSTSVVNDLVNSAIDTKDSPMVWTIDRMCIMPSMSMLDQLCTDILQAKSMVGAVDTVARRVLLERTSIEQLYILAYYPRDNLFHFSLQLVSTVRPLLNSIQLALAKLSKKLEGFPMDLRWLPDMCKRIVSTNEGQMLSCLLNTWNILLVGKQLHADLLELPANSWSALSNRVHQELMDAKHLPHEVVLHYQPLVNAVQSLMASLLSQSLNTLTDSQFVQMLNLVELVRRFLCSSSITSATLAWSTLEQPITDNTTSYSCKELTVCVEHIRALLAEDNEDSRLFNLMWNSFPHLPPINCQTAAADASGGRMQLAVIFQRTMESLSVYSKADTEEKEKLIAHLSTADVSDMAHLLTRCNRLLYSPEHSPEQGNQVAEYLLKLFQLTAHSGGRGEQPAYLYKLWPLKEYWLLKALWHYFVTSEPGIQSELIDRLKVYDAVPSLLQLVVQVHRLADEPSYTAALLNTMSEWFHAMTKTSSLRMGLPLITSQHLQENVQAVPSFDTPSMFIIISNLLTDDLSPSQQSSSIDHGMDEHCPQSISPLVCVGRYKDKLNELNVVCKEIWSHASLLDCEDTSLEEKKHQRAYEEMLLNVDHIPAELKSHHLVLPAITQLNLSTTSIDERWVWLGFIQAVCTAPRGVLDPVVKGTTELQFVRDEISRIETELALRHNLALAQCGQQLSAVSTHPYYAYLKYRLEQLYERQTALDKKAVHRPTNEQFVQLVSEAKGLLHNTLNYSNLQQLVTGLQSSNNERFIAQEQMMYATLDNYIHKIITSYPLYVDIHQPHVNAIKLISYGLRRLAYLSQPSNADSVVPVLVDKMSSPTQLYSSLKSCTEGLEFITTVSQRAGLDSQQTTSLGSLCLRLHLASISNQASSSSRIGSVLVSKLTALMSHYVTMWRADADSKAKQELEDTSLYSYKQHGEEPETDEQLLDRMTQQNFPSYRNEFSDLVPSDTLGDSTDEKEPVSSDPGGSLTMSLPDQDMQSISELHCNIMLSLAHTSWYKANETGIISTQRGAAHAMLLNIHHHLLSSMQGVKGSVTARLVHLHLISAGLMTAQCMGRQLSPTEDRKTVRYDIYRDENVAEATRCLQPLSLVRTRINELLSDWPDHPLLLQVISIIERIESFLVTDALMKFTAGLELLLEKLQEWETNAARHVSVQSAMNAVSLLIIEWRKMELDGWKQSLDNVANKIKEKSTKYWFHLCSVMLPFIEQTEGDVSTVKQLADIAIQFLESSSVGDFSYRLRLLQAFTVHIGLTDTPINAPVLNSLYSIWEFYKQFEISVAAHIGRKRASLEKELKNFVKISRWNDMNFWSVRASVDKAHKTISKHMKTYHDILVCPASNLFTEDVSQLPSVADSSDDSPATLVTEPQLNFPLAPLPHLELSDSLECLPRLGHLTNKLGTACSSINTRLAAFCARSEAINSLSREIIETVDELQGLNIISGDEKEKQKKQARNIDMRKRKCLATLLHTLHKIGFSYRKGSLKLQNCQDRNTLLKSGASPPLNLEVSLTGTTYRSWVHVWKSAVKYMLRSVTRRTVFLNASSKPSKELGVDIIQKLKGYSEHMIDTLRQHHCRLSIHTIDWSSCKQQVAAIQKLCDTSCGDTSAQVPFSSGDASAQVPFSSAIQHVATQLTTTIPGIMEHIEELRLLLHSLPPESTTVSSPCTPNMLTPMANVSLYSPVWQDMMSKLDSSLCSMAAARDYLSRVCEEPVPLYSERELRLVCQHIEQLTADTVRIDGLLSNFKAGNKMVLVLHTHSAVQDFHHLLLKSKAALHDNSPCSTHISFSAQQFAYAADETVRGVLLACQRMVGLLDSHPEVDGKSSDVLTEGHITDSVKLVDSCLRQISIHSITAGVSKLTSDLSDDVNADSRQYKAAVLSACLPIFQHFIHMAQSLLCHSWTNLNKSLKLLSILYNIFTHLSSKGFCLPEELSDETDGEGGSEFHTSEGAGLGDGEGAKDISDQIEDENELDDAKRPEEREKEESTPDSAPPQEDNGIEMSENFDGAIEDAPTTEVDEEDDNASSGDEDEMDEQMGDIGDSELKEKLDDKLWGEDEKEDDKDERKEEETGKGSEEKQQEMVAKDENPEETSKDKKDTEQEAEIDEKDLNELDKEADEYNEDEKPDPYYDGDKPQQAEGDENEFDMPDNLELDEMEKEEVTEEGEEMDVDEGDEQATLEEDETVCDLPEEPEETGEEKEGEGVEEPTAGKIEPEEREKETDQQQNVESYGESTQAVDEQIVEQTAQDKGGETESKEEQGAGQSENSSQQEAGLGDSYQTGTADEQASDQQRSLERRDQSDENRVLGDTNNSSMDVNSIQSASDSQPPPKQQQQQTNTLYEHVTPEQQQTADTQAMDAANEQQLSEQQKTEQMDTDQSELQVNETNKEEIEDMAAKELKPNDLSERLAVGRRDNDGAADKEVSEEEMDTDKEVEELTVEGKGHGNLESTIHTDMQQLQLSHQEMREMKEELELKVSEWSADVGVTESQARLAWEKYDAVTSTLSHELCEQLRLILEPTQASKLKGDYRTGKRLNMRKVIAYIASQFRKDSIWLRRTEPSRREYQIAVAVDDSSSMVDNHSKQLAFEALACISNALTYLQAGEMAIASFGEDVKMVHDFSSQFTWDAGANVLRNFSFNQKKTKIAQMLNSMCTKFLSMRKSGRTAKNELAQLLMIVSDGRGLYLEGVDTVKQAVRRALNSGMFLVFVIIDNPNSKDSILDIKMPIFSASGPPQIKSYMDSFPFPFYIILRDINSLPNTLGDALRQWFELVTSQN